MAGICARALKLVFTERILLRRGAERPEQALQVHVPRRRQLGQRRLLGVAQPAGCTAYKQPARAVGATDRAGARGLPPCIRRERAAPIAPRHLVFARPQKESVWQLVVV